MRKESFFRSPRESALALLARARTLHLATTRPDGEPVLRAMHGVLQDGALWFHGSPAGEKAECDGRRAVASAEEQVCNLPSWFFSSEKGCPAATFYRSAQARGVIEVVEARGAKARVLQAFMKKYQPEGRHAPIVDGPLYADELDATLVFRVPVERVDGKDKVGQNRTPDELGRILDALWARGGPGDAAAVDAVLDANPGLEPPAFLRSAQGMTLRCAMGAESLEETANLLEGARWLEAVPRDAVVRAHLASQAWVGARGAEGELAGSVRALSDGHVALLADLVVAPAWRRLGIGKALLRLVLDHPAVRPCRVLRLHAHEAHQLFGHFGFLLAPYQRRPSDPLEMVLERDRV